MIEEGTAKNYSKTKALMSSDSEVWFALIGRWYDMIVIYRRAQLNVVVNVIQIFDSWVGALSAPDYRHYIKPVMKEIFEELRKENVPLILFGVGAQHLLLEWYDLPVDVIGLDWRTSIAEARHMGVRKVLQGNLDRTILLADWDTIEKLTKPIIDEGMRDGKHVFNLGHGVTPDITQETLKKFTHFIHTYTQR